VGIAAAWGYRLFSINTIRRKTNSSPHGACLGGGGGGPEFTPTQKSVTQC